MGRPLRLLLVEDVEPDALLVVRELRRGGFDVAFERVETAAAMSAALDGARWDVIVSDYSMPSFSAMEALALVKRRGLDLPFIIVSGTVEEDTAVEAIRAGAHDFMPKGRFARLVPAVERELREAARRAEGARIHEQLLISDRMASVGMLAAGVAHEINNPLAAVVANLDYIHEVLRAPTTDVADALADAREAADRVRNIVADLRIFSRSDEARTGPVDVHRVLESSLRMAQNEIRHRARLVKDYGEVPLVDGDETRLGQLLLNLIVNAAQAIGEGRAQRNEIRLVTRTTPTGNVLVEVHDTGPGIPPEVMPRIFEPFFTTKLARGGTGLGLAICARISADLGATLTAHSEAGRGTTFRAELRPAAPLAPTEPEPTPTGAGRRARVLVVDDEPMVGAALKRMLSPPHEVEVASGHQAIARCASGERFDVVLCDVMMPDISGMEVHRSIESLAPEQAARMIFMTGGAFTPKAREFLERVNAPRLEKPFRLADLERLVWRMLDRTEP